MVCQDGGDDADDEEQQVSKYTFTLYQLVLSFVIIWILHIEFVTTKHVFIYQDKTFILKIT